MKKLAFIILFFVSSLLMVACGAYSFTGGSTGTAKTLQVDFFPNQVAIDFTDITANLGAYLCLNNEGVEEIIDRLCQSDKRFVFKSDAGVKQLQLKQSDLYLKEEMLSNIYA